MFLSRENSWSTWHLSTVITLTNISLSQQCVDGSSFTDSLKVPDRGHHWGGSRTFVNWGNRKGLISSHQAWSDGSISIWTCRKQWIWCDTVKINIGTEFSANGIICDDVNPGNVIMYKTKEWTFKRKKCTDWFWLVLTREDRHGDKTARHLPLPVEHMCWSDLVTVAGAAYCSKVSAAPSSAYTCSGKL